MAKPLTICGVNVLPGETAKMVAAALEGDFATAGEWHDRLFPVAKALFIESNPVPTKAALAMMGRIREELRLPLVPLSDASRPVIAALLAEYGLSS